MIRGFGNGIAITAVLAFDLATGASLGAAVAVTAVVVGLIYLGIQSGKAKR